MGRSLRTMLRIWVYFTIIFLQQEIATSKVKKIILLHQSPDTDGISRYYSTQPNMNLRLQRKNEPEKKIIGDRNRQHLWVAGDQDCDDPDDGNCGKIIENIPQLTESIKHEVENNLLKRTYERLMKRTSEENFNERLMKREDFQARLMK